MEKSNGNPQQECRYYFKGFNGCNEDCNYAGDDFTECEIYRGFDYLLSIVDNYTDLNIRTLQPLFT